MRMPQNPLKATSPVRPLPTPPERLRKAQSGQRSGAGGVGYSKEVKNMADAPESWVGESVDVVFEDRSILSGKLLEVNDDGIVLEQETRHEAGPVVAGDDVEQEVGTVRERPVTVTHHIFCPWSTLLQVKMFVSITEH
jgi:hypothetical protein